ncbi:Transcription termination factor MTEF18, mitochondrial, partial [Mucuna pruriens]
MISQLNLNGLFVSHPAMLPKRVSPQTQTPCLVSRCFGAFSPLSSSKRVSRVVRTDVQHALMDYLHSTRGYTFSDAEYVSKNSPRFVESLASIIDDNHKHDVPRSLRKFLRYNPINEFEPFFESLGIGPSELHLLLPRGIIFLADDYLLLENFHALCNYGVPRNRMGKFYKEAKEIFGYASGLLPLKLQGYENLGLGKSTVVKLVVCCPLLLVGDVNCEFVAVLGWLKRIGIESDWMVNYLSCSRTYSWKRMLDTMQFLHKVGYSEEQMHNLFRENPKLLLEGFGRKLYLFFGLLLKLGVEMGVIYSYIVEYHCILSNKCAKNLLRVIGFLCAIGMGKDDIAHILSKYMHLLSTRSLKGYKTVCKELKVGKADLCQILKDDPLKLISLASKQEQKGDGKVYSHDPRNYLEKTTFLLKLGYTENSEEMAKALKMFRGRGDQLQERFDCLVEAGLDYNSVIEMIKRAPMILNQKKDVIKRKIDFLRNVLGYPLECLVGFPTYFCHDLEKIVERLSMYAWLKERNAVNPSLALSTIVASNDKRFVKYFVNVHPQGPAVWKGLKSQNHPFHFFPDTYEKPLTTQNPFHLFPKAPSFPGSTSIHVLQVSRVHSIHSRFSVKRVSRHVKGKVQDVLLDYLHSSRGYSFTDAEFISKNSPFFVKGLVSEFHGQDDDVARCLRKFLRYNPINEFEPFFESLGISPRELPLFLPRGMMYLSDDHVLLDNFHALSNYGVPRNRIGKIYQEAKVVFGYPSGLLLSKFQGYENLGLSRSMVIKLVVSCPSLLVGETSSELVMVLDWLKKIGIEHDWIGDYLSCLKTYESRRMLNAMQFLHNVGYSDKQMHNLFKENPALLLEGLEKVYVFLCLAFKLGLNKNMIYSSFIEYPHILSNKCAKNLLGVISFLCFIGMDIDDISHILSNHMHLLSSHPLKGPKAVCLQLKIRKTDLCQIIKNDPLKLISLASKLKQNSTVQLSCDDPSKHLEKTTFLLKLGYAENSEEMAKAVKRFRGRGDQLQERFDCLVEAGLDYNIAIKMIKCAPMILNQNKVVIQKKIDFLRNILGYPLDCIVSFPAYLCYDLERIMLRFSMYARVKERKAAKRMMTLSTILASSDEKFVKYVVNVHPEGPVIWEGLKRLLQKDNN